MNNFKISNLNQNTFYLLNIAFFYFTYTFMNHTHFYLSLKGEAGLIELGGAFSLFVTSIILFLCAKACKISEEPQYKFWTFIVFGILFFWAAGEELSWGQHMFGTLTPEWLATINDQNETNVHNINKKFFDNLLQRATILVTLITMVMHFRGKEYLLGFKLPEYPLNLAFMLLPMYDRFKSFSPSMWKISIVILFSYIALGMIRKNKKLVLMCILFIITASITIYFHHTNTHLFGRDLNVYNEIRETMFSVLCVIFSIQLLRDIKKKNIS